MVFTALRINLFSRFIHFIFAMSEKYFFFQAYNQTYWNTNQSWVMWAALMLVEE